MDKNFDFFRCEQEINNKWLSGNMFAAAVNPNKKPYTIIMPPPNITSRLHIGHAFDMSIQDFIIRFKRMQGFEALLLPGADHAAIATEVKVVEELKKQGIEKNSLTREQFLEHIEKWYKTYTEQITAQMKRLGISCDWGRFAFTMDATTTSAVKRVFKNLYDKKLIYRGERMINWCPNCRTALSDAEVTYATQNRYIYEVAYQTDEKNIVSGDRVIVATTRPETIFGDTAVAVNPKDKRYAKLIGKQVIVPLTGRKIPIIADEYVDMKFGTGALKITPAHDHADNQIGIKHNLPAIKVIDENGHMTGEYVPQSLIGLNIEDARRKTIEDLKKQNLFISQKNYASNVGKCYRCNANVEPTISKQWFVAMKDLAAPCIKSLNNGLTIVPKKYEKIYLHWLNNIRDWCISRQLLSGHRVPAFICEKCGKTIVDETVPSQCTCGGAVYQDPDVLDTWFSSALWPFCTLGYPEQTADFKYFYPTQTLVTAYDIIFFWVIRMVFSGIEHTGKLPFDTVLFHGLVRDMEGRKMSKSLGNGIDPVKIIEDFGTDALRFSLICGTKMDRDPRYSVEKAEHARNFINKIWNATKFFIQLSGSNFQVKEITEPSKLSIADKWIMTKFNALIKSTTKKYEKFDFGVAANDMQSFFWNDFCDWYIEVCKVSTNKEITVQVFGHVLTTFLKLLAPIMPFVTEQIYCNELNLGQSLLRESFPTEIKRNNFPKDKKRFDAIIELIKNLRAAKKENPELQGAIIENMTADNLIGEQAIIEKLSGVKVEFGKCSKPEFVIGIAKIELKIDAEAATEKLANKIAHLQAEIARGEKMLNNAGFIAKAPKSLVEEEKQKLSENKNLLANILKQ